MVSAWWLLLLLPLYIVGRIQGYNSGMQTMRKASGMVRKLLEFGNVERAIQIMDVAEGIRTKRENRTFAQRLKEMDEAK